MYISVVMPVLNGMPYFEEALESVRNQSLKDIEIIVVDGGSTDGTKEFVEEKAKEDFRIRVISADKKSMGYQYNIGIRVAAGKYIGFCESDDYFDKGMLSRCYKTAEENNFPDFVKSDFDMFIGQSPNEFSATYNILPANYKELYGVCISLEDAPMLFQRDVNMWNGIYRKDFLEEKGVIMNESFGAAFQDADFVQQVLLNVKRGIYIQDAHYHYRRDNECSSVYKDTAIFVIQELIYMIDYMLERKHLCEKYGELIMDRLFPFFCNRYGQKLVKSFEGDIKQPVENLHNKILFFLDSLTMAQREHILKSVKLRCFLQNWQVFNELCKNEYQHKMLIMKSFKEMITRKENVVIFSAGETGSICCAFLHANQYGGSIVFCDNNEEKKNLSWMGSMVYSVEDAVKIFPNALYLIPNSEFFYAAQIQLMKLGIMRGQIVETPIMGMHSAMEIIVQKSILK